MKWKKFTLRKITATLLNIDKENLDLTPEYKKLNTDSDSNAGNKKYECKTFVYHKELKQKTDSNKEDRHSKHYWHFGYYNDGIDFESLPEDLKKYYNGNKLSDKNCINFFNAFKDCPGIEKFVDVNEFKQAGGNKMEHNENSTQQEKEKTNKLNEIKKHDLYFAATALGVVDRFESICMSQETVDCKTAFQRLSQSLDKGEGGTKRLYNDNLKGYIENVSKDYGLSQVEVLNIIKDNILPEASTMEALRIVAEKGLKVNNKPWATKGKNAKLPEDLRVLLKNFETEEATKRATNKEDVVKLLYSIIKDEIAKEGSTIKGDLVEPNELSFDTIKKQRQVNSAKQTVGTVWIDDKINK